ncbi:EthD family reductase [Arthrobacter sp. I2-34]|uniref:EthD family reductase n=1 Tax=Arthrobacter hankyongi TaxID=2904801 RepID=A0ABS9LCT5_9MICC|nr:EthD family reductase [Arthrobacter hankyongi]MCG2624470.1 EthD family reductase [Arthrobacter hankyongi]
MLRKRIALLQRRSDMSFQDFDQHWATGHAEIISTLPGLKEYVQNSVRSFWTDGDPAATVDGVVEVWFDDTAVSSPENHTSREQQDDEVRFIRTLTAFTVTNRESYDARAKIWVLSPEPLGNLPVAAAGQEAMAAVPEPGFSLMERPRLLREPAAPASVVVYPVRAGDADELFNAVVDSASRDPASKGVRVLQTVSRRVR